MRAKIKQKLMGSWGGGHGDKKRMAAEEAETYSRSSSRKNKVCKFTKGAHAFQKYIPYNVSVVKSLRVAACGCGKHLWTEYNCKKCKAWSERFSFPFHCENCNNE